ncbi:MAG TPA: hypothetical protein VF624_05945, partial [Tepidisphaeraceae bacterium]
VDSLSYWTFTDVFEEGGAGDAAFHGGFGMINYRGIPKPAFHAYRMLSRLGDQRVAQSPGAIVTRHAASGKVSALAYHYPPQVPQSVPASFDSNAVAEQTLAAGSPTELTIELAGLIPGAAVVVETLDKYHGNAPAAWRAMNSPHSPSPGQIAALQQVAWGTDQCAYHADAAGRFALRLTMQPWAVVSVREL